MDSTSLYNRYECNYQMSRIYIIANTLSQRMGYFDLRDVENSLRHSGGYETIIMDLRLLTIDRIILSAHV
jgi:hypothetical protein